MRNPVLLLGYIFGTAMTVAGVLILTGYLKLQGSNGDDHAFGTIFGLVLLLLGIYRLVMTQGKTQSNAPRESRQCKVKELSTIAYAFLTSQ